MPGKKPVVEPKESYLEANLTKRFRVAFLFIIGLGFLAGLSLGTQKLWLMGLALIFEIFVIRRTDHWLEDVGNWLAGARGETKVSAVLQSLSWRGFRSVDDITVPNRGNVDHVIVGPTGVWTIETKHWVGNFGISENKITKFGKTHGGDPINQAYAEGRAIQDYLVSKGHNVAPRPILCFSADEARIPLNENPVGGVRVIGYRVLPKVIDNPGLAGTLDEKQVETIYKELLALKK